MKVPAVPPLTSISVASKPSTGSEKVTVNWIGLLLSEPPAGAMTTVGAVVSKSQAPAAAAARLSLPPTKSEQVPASRSAETMPGAIAVTVRV